MITLSRVGRRRRRSGWKEGEETDAPGDQYLSLSIALPPGASDKAKALYRELAADAGFNPRAQLGA